MTAPPGGSPARRLLIFGINYAPEQTGIAPYTTGLSEHLTTRGWRVSVVTGMPHYPQWRVPEEYRGSWRRREVLGGVELTRVRHHVPAEQSAPGRALYEATFLGQAVTIRHRRPPACVLGVVPSLSGALAAAVVARRWGAPLGLLFQDLMGQAAAQSGMPGGGLAARPARALESWAARRADEIAVVAEAFRAYLEELGVEPARICSLPNWSHVSAPVHGPADVRRSLGWGNDEQVVLHAGNMGFKQDLANVVNAARLAASASSRTRFVLMGDGNDRRNLETLAHGLANVDFLDSRPPAEFMEVLAAADVLLLNERASVKDMSLPSKITSYFLAGRPVLAAVPPEGSTAKELARSGGAYLVPAGDPSALLDGLGKLDADGALGRGLVENASRFAISDLDRGRSLETAERFVEELAARPAPT